MVTMPTNDDELDAIAAYAFDRALPAGRERSRPAPAVVRRRREIVRGVLDAVAHLEAHGVGALEAPAAEAGAVELYLTGAPMSDVQDAAQRAGLEIDETGRIC